MPEMEFILYEVVDRALKKVDKNKPKKAKSKPSLDETSRESREVKVVLFGVQSLRAFVRYLDSGGAQGRWARDARTHVEELSKWFIKGL